MLRQRPLDKEALSKIFSEKVLSTIMNPFCKQIQTMKESFGRRVLNYKVCVKMLRLFLAMIELELFEFNSAVVAFLTDI